ncbi:kinase-like domain-containing protein, partial [Cyathus striatus]
DTVTKEVFKQILDGVEHLHSKGIYHCDLKLHNIMYDSTIKLIDFGLSTSKPIRLGMVGTHGYMAPGTLFFLFRSQSFNFYFTIIQRSISTLKSGTVKKQISGLWA